MDVVFLVEKYFAALNESPLVRNLLDYNLGATDILLPYNKHESQSR